VAGLHPKGDVLPYGPWTLTCGSPSRKTGGQAYANLEEQYLRQYSGGHFARRPDAKEGLQLYQASFRRPSPVWEWETTELHFFHLGRQLRKLYGFGNSIPI